LKPLGDRDLELKMLGSSEDRLRDVLALASVRVSQVELAMKDGASVTGQLFPMPERYIGPAQVALVLVPENIAAEGDLIAFDLQGEELGRQSLNRDRPDHGPPDGHVRVRLRSI
jgi:hypothetical protein